MSKKDERALKEAVWQYLVDHSRVTVRGEYLIRFYMTDKYEFWKRVRARQKGYFKRRDMDKEESKRKEFIKTNELTKKIHNKKAVGGILFSQSKHPIDRLVKILIKPLNIYKQRRMKELYEIDFTMKKIKEKYPR